MSRTVTIKISGRGTAYGSVKGNLDENVMALKKEIQKNLLPKIAPCRQRLEIEGVTKDKNVVLDDLTLLSEYIKEGQQEVEVLYKDLGPQIAFLPVYLMEYAGPWVIYALFAMRLLPVYKNADLPQTNTQKVAFFLWMVHYTKRLLESLFVHEFGTLTMPIFNLFKNCAYYWTFAALVGFNVNIPTTEELPAWHLYLGFPWFCCFMTLNFICHMRLKYMRPKGTNAFVIPHGGLFEYITCPNYFCEIMTWFGFNILTGFTPAGVAFNIVGAWQMYQWATQRRDKFRKMFGKQWPENRYVLFPFIY